MNYDDLPVVRFEQDALQLDEVCIPATLLLIMVRSTASAHSIYEAFILLTNCGKNGVTITVNELARWAQVSVARTYESIDFLEKFGYLIRLKSSGGRRPNTYYLPDLSKKFGGSVNISKPKKEAA